MAYIDEKLTRLYFYKIYRWLWCFQQYATHISI